jgi:hypothetical protein
MIRGRSTKHANVYDRVWRGLPMDRRNSHGVYDLVATDALGA